MPWIQIGQTLLIPWVLLTLYALFAPMKLRNNYSGNYYYTPFWRVAVVAVNLLVVAVFFLGGILYNIWS